MDIQLYLGSGVFKEDGLVALCALAELSDILPKISKDEFHIRVVDSRDKLYQDLRWYEYSEWLPERKQLIADDIFLNLILDHSKEQNSRLDVVVLGKDMTAIDNKHDGKWLNFLFGLGGSRIAIVSTYQFRHHLENKKLRNLCLRRNIFHQVFHAFGLIPEWRKTKIDNSLGLHCSNICVMRQGLSVCEWKNNVIQEREKGIVLCHQCKKDLVRVLKS